MTVFGERVTAAQRAQLAARRAKLDSGARHLGWKVALGIPGADEVVGEAPLFGYLTSASALPPGAAFPGHGMRRLQIDCELAVELGRDPNTSSAEAVAEAIGGVASALEICDIGRPPGDFDEIVAENVFHRAIIFGPFASADDRSLPGRVWVNGQLVAQAPGTDPLPRLAGLARLLLAVGEGLRAGDRIICGAICSVHPDPGDEVELEVGDLGRLKVAIV